MSERRTLGENILETDDALRLRADKTRTDGSGRKIGLLKTWRWNTDEAYTRDGKKKVYAYWNGESGKDARRLSPKEWEGLDGEEQFLYKACIERVRRFENGQVRIRDNSIFLELLKLGTGADESILLASRYRLAVEALKEQRTEEGILEYRAKQGSGERESIEASRQQLKRWFSPYAYEYNLVIKDKVLGEAVRRELTERAEGKDRYETGVYIKGSGTGKGRTTVKMYDMGYHSGELKGIYKIELTFRKQVFKRLGIDITALTEQECIISRMRAEIVREILGLSGGEAVEQLKLAFMRETNEQETVLSRIVKLEREQAKQGREQAKQGSRLEILEKEVRSLRKIEKKIQELEARK